MDIIDEYTDGLYLLESRVFKDDRGHFLESFNSKNFLKCLPQNYGFCQDNVSVSSKNTVRGLHFQKPPFTQTKLVTCLNGHIHDIVVDLRAGSATYGQTYSFHLTADSGQHLLVPKGFAHGFVALEDNTVVHYKVDNFYEIEADGGIHWQSPLLKLNWPIEKHQGLLSPKDVALPEFTNEKFYLK